MRIKHLSQVAATLAVAGSSLFLASGSAFAASNPYTPQEICGSGYVVVSQFKLANGGAEAYLLYSNSTGLNCATTVKLTDIGTSTYTGVQLIEDGGADNGQAQGGDFKYYAGPVYISAPGVCVSYAGSDAANVWQWDGPTACG